MHVDIYVSNSLIYHKEILTHIARPFENGIRWNYIAVVHHVMYYICK